MWPRSLGVLQSQAGRTAHYEKVLRHWKDAYRTASDEEGREVFPDFVSTMREIFDFVSVHKAFGNLPTDELVSRSADSRTKSM